MITVSNAQSIEHNSSCACLKVEYRPLDNKDGTYRESWECVDCGANFVKKRRHEADIKKARVEESLKIYGYILATKIFDKGELAMIKKYISANTEGE